MLWRAVSLRSNFTVLGLDEKFCDSVAFDIWRVVKGAN